MLALWGACGPRQWQAAQEYRATGRPVICLDVGYFQREAKYGADRQCKIALNDPHPEYLPDAPADRFERLGIKLRDLHDPSGPVIVAGLGAKSRRWLYGNSRPDWELDAIEQARKLGHQVVYRPKAKFGETLPGIQSIGRKEADIETVLRGANLVISRHSNVTAVDAVILGVPAVCETGPGVNIWPRKIKVTYPDREARRIYLQQLAYWSWSVNELKRGDPWDWILQHA